MNHEHGQVEKVYPFGAAHDDVPYPWNDVAGNVVGHAVFYNDISFMAVKAAAEHHFGLSDGLGKVFHAFVHGDHGLDVEMGDPMPYCFTSFVLRCLALGP